MNLPSVLVFVIILVLVHGHSQTTSVDHCVTSRELIQGINRTLKFLEENYKEINLDGFVGFVLLKDFIGNIIGKNRSDQCRIQSDLKEIYKRLLVVNKAALSRVTLSDPKYFHSVMRPIRQFCAFDIDRWRRLRRNENDVTYSNTQQQEYNEDEGDNCLNEITGGNCTVSEKCSKLFLSRVNAKSYIATHIALYLIIYKQIGCTKTRGRSLSAMALERMTNDVCLGILQENVELLKSDPQNVSSQLDIFFERIVICGGKLGFVDFFSNDAYNVVRKSQDRQDGCIRNKAYLANVMPNDNSKNRRMESLQNPFDDRVHLSKRRDSVMKDGCGSHLLGLGAAGYGAYLKYFLRNDMLRDN